MLKIAYHRLFYLKVIEELERDARILGGNEVAVVECFNRARRKIAEISYRCSDNIQLSAHLLPSV